MPPEQIFLVRFRQLVDTPRETLDRVSDFLGVATGVAHTVPPENVKPYVADTPGTASSRASHGPVPHWARSRTRGSGGASAGR